MLTLDPDKSSTGDDGIMRTKALESLIRTIGNVSENSNIDNLNGRGNKLKQGISWAEIVRSKKTRDKNNERIDSLNNINSD